MMKVRGTRRLLLAGAPMLILASVILLAFATAALAAPPNDNFFGARRLEGTYDTDNGSSLNSGVEFGEPTPSAPAGAPDNTVWWKWTAPWSTPTTVSLSGSDGDTWMAA